MHEAIENLPFISVVIPVLNNSDEIVKTLDALCHQTYPRDRFEIIVIDNGSEDDTVKKVKSYPEVRLLFEHNYKGSPYSARNRGIETARGTVIAFLDATCEPVSEWLDQGVKTLVGDEIDLVGGNVLFRINGKPTITNIYERLTTLRVKDSIETSKSTVTANLFVYKSLFDKIGLFPEGLRSGGDTRWTKRASAEGYTLMYSEHALVYKKPRSAGEFLVKMWRFGKARPQRWEEENIKVNVLKLFVNAFRPPARNAVRKIISERGQPDMEKYLTRLWLYHYAVKFTQSIGNIYGIHLIRSKIKGKK